MKIGRELDALVAEKIFGAKLIANPFGTDPHCDFPGRQLGKEFGKLPKFSTDIAAAWEVLEALKKRGAMVHVHFTESQWMASWRKHNDPPSLVISAFAKTAPHAICLAALKAIAA
jgi:hypothetical protein